MTRSLRPLAILVLTATLVAACSSGGAPAASASGRASTLPVSASPSAASTCPTKLPPALGAGQKRLVTIATAKGTIAFTIEADLGPLAAGNFVALAACGFYDGIAFHRVIPGFVIQGGDPTGTGNGGPGYEFADDPVKVPYERGVVAMANGGPDTNGSQFFIVLGSPGLEPNYSIFGRVTAGMDVADAIAAAAAGQQNPSDPVVMDKVTVSTP